MWGFYYTAPQDEQVRGRVRGRRRAPRLHREAQPPERASLEFRLMLASGSSLITFSFGFHFQVGSRRDSWKVFRYN